MRERVTTWVVSAGRWSPEPICQGGNVVDLLATRGLRRHFIWRRFAEKTGRRDRWVNPRVLTVAGWRCSFFRAGFAGCGAIGRGYLPGCETTTARAAEALSLSLEPPPRHRETASIRRPGHRVGPASRPRFCALSHIDARPQGAAAITRRHTHTRRRKEGRMGELKRARAWVSSSRPLSLSTSAAQQLASSTSGDRRRCFHLARRPHAALRVVAEKLVGVNKMITLTGHPSCGRSPTTASN